VRRADNPTTFMCRLSRNLGASISWNPKGLSRPVMGLLYLYLDLVIMSDSRVQTCCVKPLLSWRSVATTSGVATLAWLVFPGPCVFNWNCATVLRGQGRCGDRKAGQVLLLLQEASPRLQRPWRVRGDQLKGGNNTRSVYWDLQSNIP
jgi:hypothetical protein